MYSYKMDQTSKIVTIIKSETQSKSVGGVAIWKSLWITQSVSLHPKGREKRRQECMCEDRKVSQWCVFKEQYLHL